VTEVRSLITKGDPQVARAAPEVGTGPTVQPAGNPPPSFPLPNADDPNEPQERAALPALRLALALLKEGRNDEAKEFLTKVTATYPNTRAAAHARELLQKLPK
jgi:hypothetical protein